MQSEIEGIYNKIENLLIKLIPENWKSIYLYASVLKNRRGEMYFYYFPKKIIKTNPVNCYQVPDKFGIDERSYNESLAMLYGMIQDLQILMLPRWTNITISIEKDVFTIEYHYNNIEQSRYSDEERRIVWGAKYLGIPKESMNLKEKSLVETYNERSRIKPTIYSERIIINKDDIIAKKQEVKNQILKY